MGIEKGKELHELSLSELRSVIPDIGDDVFEALSIESTLRSKSAIGGTAYTRVAEALASAKRSLEDR